MTPAERIASALKGYRIGKDQWRCPCVVHKDSDPSMDVRDTGDGRVLVCCRTGCAQDEIIKALKARNLWPDGRRRETEEQKAKRLKRDEGEQQRMRGVALRIFNHARLPRRTLGHDYLKLRGLDLPPSPDVRFHPRCPRKHSFAPALVILMRNYLTGEPQAIQRIYIDPKTATKDRCDHSPSGALMLGPAEGAAMMLTPWDRAGYRRLYVCEGFETACAILQHGRSPVWALGDAGRIARFPPLEYVGELVICADHDRVNETTGKRAGIDAAMQCRERWADNRPVTIVAPKDEGTDYADIWGRHGEADRQPA